MDQEIRQWQGNLSATLLCRGRLPRSTALLGQTLLCPGPGCLCRLHERHTAKALPPYSMTQQLLSLNNL